MVTTYRFWLHVAVFSAFLALFSPFGVISHVSSLAYDFNSPMAVYAADRPLSDLEEAYNWRIMPGDWIKVNVSTNTLYFVRKDLSRVSASISVGSGLQSMVSWLGMTYFGATPVDEWIIKDKQQKSLYWVFGSKVSSEQLFMRMYRNNGEENHEFTHYGLHTTPNVDTIISDLDGYGSYGCVLAPYDLLKFIEEMLDFQLEHGEEGVKMETVE
jgi:hypothetical protein